MRVALSSPSAYKVRSARNVIRLELEPEPEATRADVPLPEVAPASASGRRGRQPPRCAATLLDKVRADHTRTATTITLAGNGRLTPSSLTESDDQPRRLVLDFPNVSPGAAPRTGVDSVFVKQVRVALNSRDPLVTRVVMEISPSATYHVERTGPDGRDLAVVFEGRKAGSAILVAPPDAPAPSASGAKDDDDTHHARAGDRQRRRRSRRRIRSRRCAAPAPAPAASAGRPAGAAPRRPRAAARAAAAATAAAGDAAAAAAAGARQTVLVRSAGQRAEAVHRPPDQLRLRGRRPARRAARVRERERPEHDHRPAGAGARQRRC